MRLQYVEYTENLSKSLTVYEIRVYGSFISLVIERVDFSSTPFDQKTLAGKKGDKYIHQKH